MKRSLHRSLSSQGFVARRSGFTLIELLAAMGVIILMLGAGGLALAGRGGEGVALSNGQTALSGMVTLARSQAVLHQTAARLLVYGNQPPAAAADANKYLRTFQVVRQEGSTWVAVGDPVTLPPGVCVVPQSPVPTTHLRTGVTWNNNVTTGPVSTLTTATGFSFAGQSLVPGGRVTNQYFGVNGTGRVLYLEFDATGVVTSNTTTNPTRIALATAVLAPSALPQFNNAFGVRGIFIRKSGAISFVNDATSF